MWEDLTLAVGGGKVRGGSSRDRGGGDEGRATERARRRDLSLLRPISVLGSSVLLRKYIGGGGWSWRLDGIGSGGHGRAYRIRELFVVYWIICIAFYFS